MINLKIDVERSVNDVINSNFSSVTYISDEALIELVYNMTPSDYPLLFSRNILSIHSENGNLPTEVFNALNVCNDESLINDMIVDSVLSPYCLDKLITKYCVAGNDISYYHLYRQKHISDSQVLKLADDMGESDLYDLFEVLLITDRLQLVKQIMSTLTNKEEYYDNLFVNTAHMLLTNEDAIALIGKERPYVSADIILEFGPCTSGWKRLRKHANRNQAPVPWNVLLARHLIANADAYEDAISDWNWLADEI